MDAETVSLDVPAEIFDELTRVTENLKEMLGPNADMWFSESRIR